MTMAERRVATGIGHTSRLPQRVELPHMDGNSEKEVPDKDKWRRSSIGQTSQKSLKPIDAPNLPKLNMAGQLTKEEVQKRISGSTSSKTVMIGGRKITYAFLTQTGFYPDNMLKPNQDAYSIKHNIGGEEGVSHFGVYDGHGEEGHQCATYVKSDLVKKIDQFSRRERVKAAKSDAAEKGTKFVFNPKIWPALTQEQSERMCKNAYVATNEDMHKDKKIPDKLNGTTAISALLYGNKMTIACAGDSRAVLGTAQIETSSPEDDSNGKTLVATPLSHDQTPYRKDELDRVRKAGARVKTIDQLNNNEPEQEYWDEKEVNYDGDIPRIWKQNDEYPGTAFTRSLGDSIAEDLGVIAEPELLTRELTSKDKVLVLATDGIFEFLTNQKVLDICTEHLDPLDACKEILTVSYEEWLEYETRVDDMTIIVIYL